MLARLISVFTRNCAKPSLSQSASIHLQTTRFQYALALLIALPTKPAEALGARTHEGAVVAPRTFSSPVSQPAYPDWPNSNPDAFAVAAPTAAFAENTSSDGGFWGSHASTAASNGVHCAGRQSLRFAPQPFPESRAGCAS